MGFSKIVFSFEGTVRKFKSIKMQWYGVMSVAVGGICVGIAFCKLPVVVPVIAIGVALTFGLVKGLQDGI